MKTMNEVEIDQIIAKNQILVGSQLQQVRYNESALQLNFYKESTNYWLTLSLKPGNPYFFITAERVFLIKNLKKPLSLFAKTHFNNISVLKIERIYELGRVFRVELEGNKSIYVTLIPGRVNVEFQAQEKTVYANKPKELKEHLEQVSKNYNEEEKRDSSFFLNFWNQKMFSKKSSVQPDLQKEIKKKQSGLLKMTDKLKEMETACWKLVGEWLKQQANYEQLPRKYESYVNQEKTIAWNIENCFHKQKKSQLKIEGTKLRIQELSKEIESLQTTGLRVKKVATAKSLLKEASLKGKTIEFPEGRLFVGKSGADNLKLLRKAKPWYLWLHIKDFPGAYGILERSKKQGDLSESTLHGASLAVIRQSLPTRQNGQFDVIYAECRYVRPIKGAKSGQVTYSHEKVISVKV